MENDKSWQRVLDKIKDQISAANFKTWFSQTSAEKTGEDSLTVLVSSAFVKGQLISRYESLINQAIKEALGKEHKIDFKIDSSLAAKKQKQEGEDLFPSAQGKTSGEITLLNPKYTLKNFVVGMTNNLAYAAALAVVQNPGISYNPLFIYGPSGVGKTHLMHGIGNTLLNENPSLKIIAIPSERFTVDFVEAIQNKRTGDFRQKYRRCDVLLVDDIQFMSGKDSTQEEFFHTFNELHSKNIQVVLTSDRSPNEIQKLEPRLQSRFQGGLMVDVQLPDFDTRVAILKAKLGEKNEKLPEEGLRLIAEHTASNTRELEGKLIQILQMVKISNQEPSVELIQQFLGRPRSASSVLDHKKVISGINQYFNVKTTDLTGPRRQKELVLPRQIAMYLMYEECKIPMEKIGQILGGRDHTTVLHGVEKIKQVSSRDREVQRMIIEIKQQLTS